MKLLVWDFDGTIGYREGRWSGAFSDLLGAEAPDFHFASANLSAVLQSGFPWHTPAIAHPHIRNADEWWAMQETSFEKAFTKLGLDATRAVSFAKKIRPRYCSANGWHLYPDSMEALARLSTAGWEHILLSNHVPELPHILDGLGLRDQFRKVVNSAFTGYEKPHPHAYAKAIEEVAGIDDLRPLQNSGETRPCPSASE